MTVWARLALWLVNDMAGLVRKGHRVTPENAPQVYAIILDWHEGRLASNVARAMLREVTR